MTKEQLEIRNPVDDRRIKLKSKKSLQRYLKGWAKYKEILKEGE